MFSRAVYALLLAICVSVYVADSMSLFAPSVIEPEQDMQPQAVAYEFASHFPDLRPNHSVMTLDVAKDLVHYLNQESRYERDRARRHIKDTMIDSARAIAETALGLNIGRRGGSLRQAQNAPAASNIGSISWYYVANNETDIAPTLAAIDQYRPLFSSVILYCGYTITGLGIFQVDPAYTWYCEGPGGMIEALRSKDINVELTIQSPTGGGDPIAAFRNAFISPAPLYTAVLALATRIKPFGINFDWVPMISVAQDNKAYSQFLMGLRLPLNLMSTRLTASVGQLAPMISNYGQMMLSVDRMIDVSTYGGPCFWDWYLANYSPLANSQVPKSSMSIGFGCYINDENANTWAAKNESISKRVDQVLKDGIQEITLYQLSGSRGWPADFWWPHLARFMNGTL
jgi:hypothetical protein